MTMTALVAPSIVSLPARASVIVLVAEQEPDSSKTMSRVPVGKALAAGSVTTRAAVSDVKAIVRSVASAV